MLIFNSVILKDSKNLYTSTFNVRSFDLTDSSSSEHVKKF